MITSNNFIARTRPKHAAPALFTGIGANGSATINPGNVWTSVIPAGVTVSDWLGDYCGVALCPWYCPGGAVITWGGGHSGSQTGAALALRFDTLVWERIGGVIADADRKWANGSEIEVLAAAAAEPPGAARYANAPVEQTYAIGGLRGWYRYTPGDSPNPTLGPPPSLSKWPGQVTEQNSDYRRKGGTYGEIAPGVPAPSHTYSTLVCLPPGVLGGGPKGSLIVPLQASYGPGSGNHTYFPHQLDLASGVWRRMADEIGSLDFYNTRYGHSGDSRYQPFQNQPNESHAFFDPQECRLLMYCTFGGFEGRAIAMMDLNVPVGTERWEMLPSSVAPAVANVGVAHVARNKYSVMVRLRSDGTLQYVSTRRGPYDVAVWVSASLSGAALPGGAGSGLTIGGTMHPSMDYWPDNGKIAIYGKGGAAPWATNQDIFEATVPAVLTDPWVCTRRTISGSITAKSVETWRSIVRTDFANPAHNRYVWLPSLAASPQVIN